MGSERMQFEATSRNPGQVLNEVVEPAALSLGGSHGANERRLEFLQEVLDFFWGDRDLKLALNVRLHPACRAPFPAHESVVLEHLDDTKSEIGFLLDLLQEVRQACGGITKCRKKLVEDDPEGHEMRSLSCAIAAAPSTSGARIYVRETAEAGQHHPESLQTGRDSVAFEG